MAAEKAGRRSDPKVSPSGQVSIRGADVGFPITKAHNRVLIEWSGDIAIATLGLVTENGDRIDHFGFSIFRIHLAIGLESIMEYIGKMPRT